MDYLVTFLEGIITFISPCLLPMLPLYLAYFAGDASAEGVDDGIRTRRTLIGVAGFSLGFTLVFVLLGAFAGAFGSLLVQHAAVVNAICGAIVIIFGIHFTGLVHIPLLDRTLRPATQVQPSSFFAAFVFGVVFAVGWTPCVGVFLGSALALAAVEASALQGVLLLLCYSAGLAIPFAVSALAIERIVGAFDAIKRHYKGITMTCGILLVIMGVLMATGLLSGWLQMLGSAV